MTNTITENQTISLYRHLPRKRLLARESFAKDLGHDYYHPTMQKLVKACITHHRYCECECNGCTREKLPFESWDSYDKAREAQMLWLEQAKDKLEKRIAKLCASLNLFACFEGDPRGCTVKIQNRPFVKGSFNHLDTSNARGADVWNW